MKANEAQAVAGVVLSEGPELNVNPPGTPPGQGEPGGASKYGVSVDALTDYHRALGKPAATVADVAALTEAGAITFYTEWVMPKLRFDELPSGVDYRAFDVFTNLGTSGGIDLLELAVGRFPPLGKFDDHLLAAVKAIDPRAMVLMIGAQWITKKRTQPGWIKSGHGWSNRRTRVDAQALSMVEAGS
jgi:lysozyme family protein